jgi:hypothetical protein
MAKDIYNITIKSAFDVKAHDRFYYVKTDPRQLPRQLTSLTLDIGSGGIMYGLTHGDEEEVCYAEMQITENENVLMREKYGDDE